MSTEPQGEVRCAVCGGPLPTDTAEVVCPRCALGGALELKPEVSEAEIGEQKVEDSGPKAEIGEERLGAEDRGPNGDSSIASRQSPIGNQVGDYELLEKVGEGGMGVVFKARQRSLDRIVAVKLLRLGPHAAPEFVKRFRAEAVAAASLQHPHIVAIHEVGSHQGQHFFVMDYVEGQSLARLVGNRPLPVRHTAQYVKGIAEAVHYAHERGLLHRDLKPANVLVDADNQVRVMDFGLARRLEGDSELTLTGQVLGSPHYMPPEQAAGKRGRLSRRTDVYGLGAILYHLLTGRPPFVGEELADTLQHVLHSEPLAPRLLNPAVPRDLETICLKCLEKEAARRYATAAAVADELGRYLQDQLIEARPVTRPEKIRRWCRRQPVRAGLSAALLTVFLLGAAGVLWQWRRAERNAQGEARQRLHAQRLAYGSDMNLAFQAAEADERGRALELLNRYWPEQESKVHPPWLRFAATRSPKSKAEFTARAASPQPSTLNPQPSTDLRGWEWRHLWLRLQSDAVPPRPLANYYYLIAGLAVSADGRWLALTSGSNLIVWDMVARQAGNRFTIVPVPGAVDISADGRLVACAEAEILGPSVMFTNCCVVVFDTTTRGIVARLPHLETKTWLAQIAFSPDARVLASLDWDRDKGSVRLWSLETKQCFHTNPVSSGSTIWAGKLRFSPDGQRLAIGQSSGLVQILDLATTNVLLEISPPDANNPVTALAFSAGGRQLAASYGWTNIYLWNAQTGGPIGQLAGHRNQIDSLCFLPDGQTLASGSHDATIRLWDLAKRTETRRFSGHAGEVHAVVALADGRTLVSGGEDGDLCLWNTEYRKPEYANSLPVNTRDFAFTPDSRRVLTVNRAGRIEAWETATLQPVSGVDRLGTNNLCLAVAARAERTLLAAGKEGGWLELWDISSLAQPQVIASLQAHSTSVVALKFGPRGQTLLSSTLRPGWWADSSPDHFKAWDTATLRERAEFRVGSHTAAYLPDANLLVVRRPPLGLNLGVLDLRTDQEQVIATSHKFQISVMVFSPDGRRLAIGCGDGVVTLWEVGTWRCLATLRGAGVAVVDLAFSPDGQRLVSASNPVRLWDLATQHELASLGLDATNGDGAAAAFSPDGNTLAVRDKSGTIHLWRAPSLAEIDGADRSGN